MKIKAELNLEVLEKYGFELYDNEEVSECFYVDGYAYCIGHSRRGQHYYLLVDSNSREISIYASEPDGSGGSINCPDILLKMFLDGIIENIPDKP